MKTIKRLLVTAQVALALSGVGSLARAQDDGSAGEPIVASINPANLTYNILVDGTLTADDPANNKYMTLQDAYAAAPAGTATSPTVIGIMPNVYQITGTATTPGLTISKNYITLLGITNDRRTVVLADNRGNQEGAGDQTSSNNGYVIIVNATGFTAENLTFLNYCNVNYQYPGDPTKNLTERSSVITQAVALQASGDKHTYINVAFLSRLDTTFIETTRAYFQNCYIEGTDDFIGGGTESFWQDCQIYFPTGGGVPSVSGTVFQNCSFSSTNGMEFYKGDGSPTALINCTLPVNTPQAPVAWVDGGPGAWGDPLQVSLYSLTYHCVDTNGNPAVVADYSMPGGPQTFTRSREISDQEALAFNPWNVLQATPTGVADGWDPAGTGGATGTFASQGNLIYRMSLTGGNLPDVRTGQTTATVGATVDPARAPNQTITWSSPSSLVSLSASTGASVVVSGQNTTLQAQTVPVYATAANGFFVTAWIFVEPQYIAPPAVISPPVLSPPLNGKVSVSYTLNLGTLQDQSVISWFSCDDALGTNPEAVAVSRGNTPLTQYILTLGDIGRYLEVEIQPKSSISDPGTGVFAIASTPIQPTDVASTVVAPDFKNFVVATNTAYVSGRWALIGTWTSDAATSFLPDGYGVRVGSQGASMNYQADGNYGDMEVDLIMSPEKTGGQGFGSPGSGVDGNTVQKSDVYIKYDPRSQNGYSLRFWRTVVSSTEVEFQMYQIVNGVGSPISNVQELTGVFKPSTFMTLTIVGNVFTAQAYNDVDTDTLFLQSTITPNNFGGSGVYWSGTVPSGNSNVYTQYKITYLGTIQLITTAALTQLPAGGGYQTVVTVKNVGSGTAVDVQLNTASLGAAGGAVLPAVLGNITAGGSATETLTFPASAGSPGSGAVEKYTGSYIGGTFNGSIRAVLP